MNEESPLFVEGFEEPLCQKVEILKKIICIETGEEELIVKIHSKANGFPFIVSRKEFVKRSFFDKLTQHGLSVIEDDESYADLRSTINESERHAPVAYRHESIGFRKLQGTPCFLGYHPIGQLPPQLLTSTNEKMEETFKPQGDFNEWKSFIRKYVVPNVERTLALILGVTAPVSHVLKDECEFVDVAVWALINSSSKGKSTMLYLISSLYANPRFFIDTFNATSNALYAMLEERGAYPFLCDEATHTPNIDWDGMLYTLPTGKERRRCDAKGKLKPLVEFSGAIIMTSEVSILDRSQGYGGQNCRIMEFELDPFKDEEILAEKMRSFCFQNYGWATDPLVSLLLDPYEREKLVKKYRQFFRRLEKQATFAITGVERRLLQRCALILTSGWVLRKAVECNFELLELERFLVDHLARKIETRDDRDDADKLLDKIRGFICANRDMFPTVEALAPSSSKKHYGAFWGATGFYGTKACIWVQEEALKNRILPQEMKNANTTLQTLREKNYIVKFYDKRYFIDRRFGGINAKYCCIFLPDSPTSIEKIEKASVADMSVASLNAHIGSDYDKSNYKFLDARKDLAYVELSHAEMQSYAMIVSKPFQKRMAMTSKSTMYATPFPAQKALLLSKTKVAQNSLPCYFEKSDDRSVAKGIGITNLQAMLALNVPLGYKIVTQEITIEDYKGKTAAVIVFDEYTTSVEPLTNPIIDYTVTPTKDKRSYQQIKSLLEEDENEF